MGKKLKFPLIHKQHLSTMQRVRLLYINLDKELLGIWECTDDDDFPDDAAKISNCMDRLRESEYWFDQYDT